MLLNCVCALMRVCTCLCVCVLTVCVRVVSGNVQRRTVQEPVLWREELMSTPLMEKCTRSMGIAPTF